MIRQDRQEKCNFATIAEHETVALAKRILILGGTGVGKTTLARKLVLPLPSGDQARAHIEVDRIYWQNQKGGAVARNFESLFRGAIACESWIVEGHYGKTKPILLQAGLRPDLILVLKVSEVKRVWRLIKRDLIQFALGRRLTSDTWWYFKNRRVQQNFDPTELIESF